MLSRGKCPAYTAAIHFAADAPDVRQWSRSRCVFPTTWHGTSESAAELGTRAPRRARAARISIPSRATATLRNFVSAWVALIAPDTCRLCERRLLQTSHYPVCDACLSQLFALPQVPGCTLCGDPLAPERTALFREAADQRCEACSTKPPRFVRATAFGPYDELRQAIRLLKFEGVYSLAKPMGRMLAEAILQHQADVPAGLVVVPVPLFRGKRPYNQSTLLARAALKHTRRVAPGWTLLLRPKLLHRIRQTESQFLLSPNERRNNLRSAFQADGGVRGLDVLLIDDVYTTGTTARECTKTLLAAGARSVRVATLARAGRDTAVRWKPGRLDSPSVATGTDWQPTTPG